MSVFSVYEVATGRMTGAQVSASTGELIAAAIPDGCAVVLGAWDYLSHEVIHATGDVVPVSPPTPDWRERMAAAASIAYGDILQAEAEQARPMRELVEAMLAGVSAAPEAIARFEALKSRIDLARSRYNALLAATTEAELDAIVDLWPV